MPIAVTVSRNIRFSVKMGAETVRLDFLPDRDRFEFDNVLALTSFNGEELLALRDLLLEAHTYRTKMREQECPDSAPTQT